MAGLAFRPIDYNLINSRKIEKNLSGEDVINLLDEVIDPKYVISFEQGLTRISKELEGKPTAVGKLMSGFEDNTDIILHYNAISNPYTVASNMTFIMPNIEDVGKSIASKRSAEKRENKSKKELNKRTNLKDKKRIFELMKQNNSNVLLESANGSNIGNLDTNNPLVSITDGGINTATGNTATLDDLLASLDFVKTPNMTESEQFKVIDGKIIFGTNISNKRCSGDITATQGKTEMIRKTVRDLIINKEI